MLTAELPTRFSVPGSCWEGLGHPGGLQSQLGRSKRQPGGPREGGVGDLSRLSMYVRCVSAS